MKILEKNEIGRGFLIEMDGYILAKDNQEFVSNLKENFEQPIEKRGLNLENPVLYAVLQKADMLNRNGRVYPQPILEREVMKYNKAVEFGTAFGEKSHPESSTVETANIALIIKKMWWDGITLMGEILLPITQGFVEKGLCSNEADKIANLMRWGGQFGVSSRGVGSVKRVNGNNVVQEDFELICWDIVTNPSTLGAWVFPNLEETSPYVSKSANSFATPQNSGTSQKISVVQTSTPATSYNSSLDKIGKLNSILNGLPKR